MRNLTGFFVALILAVACSISYLALQSARAQTSCAVQAKGAVGWYPGDGTANDIARANHGTPQAQVTYAAGHAGQAFAFDGDTDAVAVGNPEHLRLQNFTIESWVKRASATQATLDSPDAGLIFGYGQNGYAFYIFNDGRLALGKIGVNGIDTAEYFQFPALKITDTNFHHVAVTKSGNEVRFYLDGVISRKFQYDTPFEFTTNAAIGARGDNFRNSFYGAIDELTIYARALNHEQIVAIRDAGTGGKCKETRVQFEHATYPAGEASGEFSVRVTRTGDTSGASSVSYATADGTAQAAADYTQTSGTLAFTSGEQAKTIEVPVTNDTAAEADETLQLTLSDPTNSALGAESTTTLKLFNTVPGAGRIILPPGNSFSTALFAYNTDGSNSFRLTSYGAGHATHPSVARHTGAIAFEACGEYAPNAGCERGRRIYVMDADGSNVRQVTTADGLGNPQYQEDTRPVISPDGTKIAFLSARPGARHGYEEIFVIGTDGTGLRQITTKQVIDQNNESRAVSVVWSPDSTKLLVNAYRIERDANDNPTTSIGSLYIYNADGTGGKLFVHNTNSRAGQIAIDWSPDGRNILYPVYGGGGRNNGVVGYVFVNPQDATDSRFLDLRRPNTDDNFFATPFSGELGSVRFSPDGRGIVFGFNQDSRVETMNLDGTNRSVVLTNANGALGVKWWWGGQRIPQPARLELAPNPALAWQNRGEQLIPTLFDAGGNVIFRAAQWQPFFSDSPLSGRQCDQANFPNLPPGVSACTGNVNPRTDQVGRLIGSANNGEVNLCATNAGVTGCARVQNFNSIPVSVRATTPLASKQTGAPGVFTISRPDADATLVVSISVSGSARKDVDYFLRVSDNATLSGSTLTMPENETSVTLTVEPVGNSPRIGDRSIILGLLPDFSNTNAYTVNDRASIATVLLKEDRGLTQPPCNAPRVAPPANLVAWLAGDGDTLDSYGASDGAGQNGVTFAPGKVGQAFSFDGADDSVLLPSVTLGNKFTIEAWVYPTRHIGYQHIVSNDYRSPNFGALYLNNDRLNYWQGGANRVTSSSTIPLNTWTHIALAYDGNLARLYTNGALVGTSDAHASNFNNPVALGYSVQGESNRFAGRFDEVSFYSRALASEELAGIHHAGNAGKCNPVGTPTSSPALGLTGISPNRGSDKGSVTVNIRGQNIAADATVRLTRSGQADITGGFVSVGADKTSLQTIFDLRGKARGLWNVVVTNPGGNAAILPEAFTVIEGKDTKVWVKLILHPQLLFGRKLKGSIVYGNSGDADAYGVPLGLVVRKDLHLKLNFNVMPMPTLPGRTPNDHSQLPLYFDLPRKEGDNFDYKALALFVPVVPAKSTRTLTFEYGAITEPFRGFAFRTGAWISQPWFESVVGSGGQTRLAVNPDSDLGALLHMKRQQAPSVGDCLTTLGSTFAREALGALTPANCINSLRLLAFDAVTTLLSITTSPDAPGERSVVVSFSTLAFDMFKAAFECGGYEMAAGLKLVEALTKTVITLANDDNCREIYQEITTDVLNSADPNDKIGAHGVGAERYVTGEDGTGYTIFFENKPEATAPAHEVLIIDQLDKSKLDLDSFELGSISFGDTLVTPPARMSSWTTDVDMRPAKELIVRINAKLDKGTGIATWRFASIDPATGEQIENPSGGFLPPNQTTPEGQGAVLFKVNYKPDLAMNTQINNSARIFFDFNDPIDTPVWTNTIDDTPPASQVTTLPATQGNASFEVSWTGTDAGAGVDNYTIYVSEDGGAFRAWQENTRATAATYAGERNRTYRFYSIATDAVGNREAATGGEDAVTYVDSSATFALSPLADTWVQGADAARDINFGLHTAMQTKRTLNPGNGRGRRAYLKFDISTITNLSRARLRVFARLSDSSLAGVPLRVQAVADTLWDEMTLTWNTQPAMASSEALAPDVVVENSAGRWYEFDLTEFIRTERAAGRHLVSLRLINMERTGISGAFYTSINSREAASAQPQLVIEQ